MHIQQSLPSRSKLHTFFFGVQKTHRSLKLTDLPPEVLSRIIVHLSGGGPFYLDLYARAIFGPHNWRELSSIQATCRTMRDACRKAVGGLVDIRVTCTPEGETEADLEDMFAIPLATALSLPGLRIFQYCGGSTALVRHATCLKSLIIRSEIEDFEIGETWGQSPVEVLSFDTVDQRTIETVMAMPFLHLEHLSFVQTAVLTDTIPEQNLHRIKYVTFWDCKSGCDFVIQLSNAACLQKIMSFGSFVKAGTPFDILGPFSELSYLDFIICDEYQCRDVEYFMLECVRQGAMRNLKTISISSGSEVCLKRAFNWTLSLPRQISELIYVKRFWPGESQIFVIECPKRAGVVSNLSIRIIGQRTLLLP